MSPLLRVNLDILHLHFRFWFLHVVVRGCDAYEPVVLVKEIMQGRMKLALPCDAVLRGGLEAKGLHRLSIVKKKR